MDFTEETATGAVVASFAGTGDARLREFTEVDDPDEAAADGVAPPFRHASFDVVLQPTP